MTKQLTSFFNQYLTAPTIFKNKRVLQSNYTPHTISHREQQIETIARILAPSLKNEKPSNLFIYGKTGTGKTVTLKHVINSLKEVAKEKVIAIKTIYVNCKLKKVADTEYRLIAQIAREFAKEIPATGLPTEEIYNIFYKTIDSEPQTILLILDEIDQLVQKTGDEILYNLTRLNSELHQTQLSIIGISNDIRFTETLDPRVKSSLSEEEMIFPPYNAIQLQSILSDRAKDAFHKGTIEQGVLEKCAAFAAREHGDARRALELLRVAGEIADRDGANMVKVLHLDIAEEKIEKDKIIDTVSSQPKQFQVTLLVILKMYLKQKDTIFTGEVYENYKYLCHTINLHPLTQRRISDIIAEMDMLGIINAKIISKGRYGRTREIHITLPFSLVEGIIKLLEEQIQTGVQT
ncbi:MAG: ORC1-type DNA replication protein [Nanoarchaeota archaeon]